MRHTPQSIVAQRLPITGKFSTTVIIAFTDTRGRDCDCEVNVDYSFDGDDDLRILHADCLTECDIGDYELDELIWEATMDKAIDAYPEWLAEYDEQVAA